MSRPVIHVTNAASRKLHGPGRLFHAMAWAPSWLVHDGGVEILAPPSHMLLAYQNGSLGLDAYRAQYEQGLRYVGLGPGDLAAFRGVERRWIADGDTIVCVCAKDKAERGECHRVWFAPFLQDAGWRVVLDGQEI